MATRTQLIFILDKNYENRIFIILLISCIENKHRSIHSLCRNIFPTFFFSLGKTNKQNTQRKFFCVGRGQIDWTVRTENCFLNKLVYTALYKCNFKIPGDAVHREAMILLLTLYPGAQPGP